MNPSAPIQVTNDGATILRAIGVDNPAAKVLVSECMFQTSVPPSLQYSQSPFLQSSC